MPSLVSYALKALINVNSSGSLKTRGLIESGRQQLVIEEVKDLEA
jgi:hypothetical protein